MKYSHYSKIPISILAVCCSISIFAKPYVSNDIIIKNKNNIHQCNVDDTSNKKDQKPSRTSKPILDAIYLEADTGQIFLKGTSTLDGDVLIQQNDTVFTADSAKINRDNSQVTAHGNVILSNDNFKLKSPLINYNLNNKTGTINNAEYTLASNGIRGDSSQIKQLDKNRLKLKDATFTSCPVNDNSWHLASGDINLNQETQIGTAKNVTFNIGDTPVFYFPWLNFPINGQRLSGFLSPSVTLQTNAGITIPYYFNLAPNYDATISLSTLEGRGIQFNNEFRFLNKHHKGDLEYNFIPSDSSFDDKKRYYFNIDHNTQIGTSTNILLNAEGVSDEDYFDDFSSSLDASSRTVLKRRFEVIKKTDPWTISAAVEDYQILDTDDDIFSKLPELKLNYSPIRDPKNLKLDITSELVYFSKEDATSGLRGNIKSKLSQKWASDAWYFKPSLSLEHTLYSLDDTIEDQNMQRTLPTITLDGGLFFDRELQQREGKGLITQTLEPRIFYTHTPFKDQSDIPIFDTALSNFSESNQLFLENRFTGKDRIADTNQITFAVSSRIQDRKNGNELLKATLGQIFYFNDRKVTLPEGTILTNSSSDLLLELSGRLNDRFRLASTITIDSREKNISNYDLRLNYKDDKKRLLNLSFRKIEDELRQVSFSSSLPINDKWSMVVSSEYDTKNDRNLETLVGFEYQDCCWTTRLVAKRFLTSDNETYDNPVFLEFELKGLGNIGTSATRQIKEDIYGYDDF